VGSDGRSWRSAQRGSVVVAAIIRGAGAVLATSSAVLHAFTLSHAGGPIVAVAMIAMIVACLFCAQELWTTDTMRGWVGAGLMSLAMIGVHLATTAGHRHHGSVVVEPAGGASVMAVATGVAVLEVMLAATVLLYRTRHRARSLR
jgi:hypothetical protein